MTNFEKYKDEILEISRTQPIAINKRRNAPEECSYNVCSECLLHEGTYCNQKAIFQWLYSEYQEPAPKLTSAERGFCETVKRGYIARHRNETVTYYTNLAYKVPSDGYWWSEDESIELKTKSFSFIHWEDSKAWSIKDLLKLEVEE